MKSRVDALLVQHDEIVIGIIFRSGIPARRTHRKNGKYMDVVEETPLRIFVINHNNRK